MKRTVCVAVVLLGCMVMAGAQPYSRMTWYADPIRQVTEVADSLSAVAVSPSGNQIAMYSHYGGMDVRHLLASGRVGDSVQGVLGLENIRSLTFSPDGNYIIAPAETEVALLRRSTSALRVLGLPEFDGAWGVATISQRTEFYVQSEQGVGFYAVDFVNGEPLEFCEHRTTTDWWGCAIAASPDGERIHTLWHAEGVPKRCMTAAFTNTRTGRELLWRKPIDLSDTMCIGPDPDHFMLATSDYTGGVPHLIVIRGRDGHVVDHYDIPIGPAPCSMVTSQDGRYVVIVSRHPDNCLVTISGADIRGLMDPNFDIAEADVRTHRVDFDTGPRGVVLHPTLNIAYVWSASKLYVVRIGLPRV